MKTILNKKILLIVGVVGAAILSLLLFSAQQPQQDTSVVPTPTTAEINRNRQQNKLSVEISPSISTTLVPGEKQTFSLRFSKPTTQDALNIAVTETDLSKDAAPTATPFSYSVAGASHILSLTEAIKPYRKYQILIKNAASGNTILNVSYLSAAPAETPAATNNLDLIPYLPYETASYALSYNNQTNTYIFNFKYNPNSVDDLETQYQKAKQDAIDYIRSKEINESTLIIEWRYS